MIKKIKLTQKINLTNLFIGLLHADQLRCDIPYKVSEYFNESCVPNIGKLDKGGKLCKACKDGCTDSGTYAGYKGALRFVETKLLKVLKYTCTKSFKNRV